MSITWFLGMLITWIYQFKTYNEDATYHLTRALTRTIHLAVSCTKVPLHGSDPRRTRCSRVEPRNWSTYHTTIRPIPDGGMVTNISLRRNSSPDSRVMTSIIAIRQEPWSGNRALPLSAPYPARTCQTHDTLWPVN